MAKFEVCAGYEDCDIHLPERKTRFSAGYDFEAAQDIVIPSFFKQYEKLKLYHLVDSNLGLKDVATITKITEAKPTLVPTGVKCKMAPDEYLQLAIRSSYPLKHWLILANGVGEIDADYYGSSANDGNICFQIINLSPFDIIIKKGEAIGQGVIMKYIITEDDKTIAERTGGFGSTTKE